VKADNWNLSDKQISQLRKILKEREQVSQQDSFL